MVICALPIKLTKPISLRNGLLKFICIGGEALGKVGWREKPVEII